MELFKRFKSAKSGGREHILLGRVVRERFCEAITFESGYELMGRDVLCKY